MEFAMTSSKRQRRGALMAASLAAGLTAAAALGGCAINPVSGRNELSLISQSQEIQMGKDASTNDLKSVGEANHPAAQAMVRRIGQAIAAKSERPGLPWEFHLLDDAAVNAFAYPGGFIFVTRGLMGQLTNEAQLAEVIGHEIGHVTAKHTVSAMSKQQIAQIGLVGASVLSPTIAQYGDLLGTGASLLFLKFGRDDEKQADALGFKYSLAQGYDVRQAPKVFNTLSRLSSEGGGARVPEWQSTHPDPGNRVKTAQAKVDALPASTFTSAKLNRDGYLKAVEGMVYGENPRLGYFKGTNFLHPDLRFQLNFPSGWRTTNMAQAVVSQSSDNNAQLQLVPGQGTPAAALAQFTGQQGITVRQSGNTTINGNAAALAIFDAASGSSGTLRGQAAAIQYAGVTYLIIGLMAANAPAQRMNEIDAAIRSFRALTDASLINVQPATIQLVTLTQAMTGASFVQKYPSAISENAVYIMNEIDATTSLARGTVMKRVVGGVGQ